MGGALRNGGHPHGGPALVLRVDPEDGAAGVLRDSPVLLRLSRPVDPGCLSPLALEVRDGRGSVPSRLGLSPDRRVLIWRPARRLAARAEHLVIASGLRDETGGTLAPHFSRFVTGGLGGDDLGEPVLTEGE